MKYFLLLLLIFSSNLHSQVIHGSLTNFPKEVVREEVDKYMSIKPLLNYDSYTLNYQQFTLEDFDLKKDKAVKNVSYYLNEDKVIGYYLEFDTDGRITKLDDFVNNTIKLYSYTTETVVVRKYLKKDNNRISAIDSVYYDDKNNIIKKCSSYYNEFNTVVEKNVEQCEYDDKNRLIKKYHYQFDYKKNDLLTLRLACDYEYSDNKIIERKFSGWKTYSGMEFKRDLSVFKDFSEKVFYINLKGQIVKIEDKFKDKITYTSSVTYDKNDRIISLIHDNETWNSSYKYDAKNIIEITNNENNSKIMYDTNGNAISVKGHLSSKDNTIFQLFYDENKNWIHSISNNKQAYLHKIVREIVYY